jgi:hypothetical protein
MSLNFGGGIFSQSSTLLFSKPRRKRKSIRDEIETDEQEIFIIISISRRKFNFENTNIFSFFLINISREVKFVADKNLSFSPGVWSYS